MKIIGTFFIFFFFILIKIFSQSLEFEAGGRSAGLGNTNSNLKDEWSIFNNVGGISGVENGAVFFGYNRYFGLEGFDKVAAGVIHPLQYGNIGLSFFRCGDQLFSEQVISAAFGNRIGFVNLGFRANYYQMSIEDFGTAGTLYFDLGGIVELIPKLSFGAYISNFTLSHIYTSEKTTLPVIMKVGFSYQPVNELQLNIDLHKDVDYAPVIKAGIEYLVSGKLYLRTGINTNPFRSFFGAGILLNRFKVDYAIGANQFLANSHQASVSFNYLNKHE